MMIKKILHPNGWLTLLLVVVSAALLILALTHGTDTGAFNLFAYTLSAYALVVVCLKIPTAMKALRDLVEGTAQNISTGNEKLDALIPVLMDYEQRSRYTLYLSLGFNLIYAVFKLATGLYYHSVWMGALGIYYAVLAALRFSLMRSIHRDDAQAGRAAYRRTAWLLNLLTVTMSGIFVQMVIQNRAYHYPGILIYVMAMWAFGKIITAVVNLIRRRREENLVLAASRSLSFAGALMSILALQTAMISQFGEDSVTFAQTMNAIGGGVVTALLITLSALMVARSSAWQEERH